MKNLFIIVLLLVISTSLFSDDFYEMLNEGSLSFDSLKHNVHFKIGHFINSSEYSLIGFDLSNICLFEIKGNNLNLVQSEMINLELNQQKINDFIIGDFNNDEIDELIVFINKTIYCFEWDGSSFQISEYDSPYYIHQCVIGDITNDGRNDLILSCMDDSLASIFPQGEYNTKLIPVLVTYNYDNVLFSNLDTKNLDLKINCVIPSDKLVVIFDLNNDGKKELITSDRQSDVSPTYFRMFNWNQVHQSFSQSGSFEFSNFQLNSKPLEYKKLKNYISGKIYPIIINETNYFLANIWGTKRSFTASVRLLSIENRNLISHGEIAEKKSWANNTFIFQNDDDIIHFLQLNFKNHILNYTLGYLHF